MIALRRVHKLLLLALLTALLFGVFVPTVRAASMDFVYPPPEAAGDERHLYYWQLLDAAHARGCRLTDQEILDIWHLDLELNAQGLAYWLEAQDPG